jgi:hypothetical protein
MERFIEKNGRLHLQAPVQFHEVYVRRLSAATTAAIASSVGATFCPQLSPCWLVTAMMMAVTTAI